jgi:hypothetical protein
MKHKHQVLCIFIQTPLQEAPQRLALLLLVKFALLHAGWCIMEGNTRVNRGGVLASEVIPSTYKTSLLVCVQLLLPMT